MLPLPLQAPDPNDRAEIPYAAADLLPQSGAMVLLDQVIEVGEGHIVTELLVRDDGLFVDSVGAVPAWVGLEYMAQTVAAYAGYRRKLRGQAVDLGFLLGTRCYECSVPAFPVGARLRVRAERNLEGSNGLSVFDCGIEAGAITATARLNVFLPLDSRAYLAERGL